MLKLKIGIVILFSLGGLNLAQALENTPTVVTAPVIEDQMRTVQSTLDNRIYPAMSQQAENIRRMNQTMQQSLMGSYGIGASNNLAREQKFRDWTPSSADLMNMVAQGLQTGSLSDQLAYYNQKFPVLTAEQLSPSQSSSPVTQHQVFSAIAANAALSIADKSFDRLPEIMEQLNFLYRQIDQQQNLKQAQDLNSVILLKIAALQADLLRVQAQQLKIQAVDRTENHSRRAFMAGFVEDPK